MRLIFLCLNLAHKRSIEKHAKECSHRCQAPCGDSNVNVVANVRKFVTLINTAGVIQVVLGGGFRETKAAAVGKR